MADQHEDKALIEAAQHNTEAFAALYSKYVDKIYNYIYYRVNAHATTAEDLTAEVFMRALRRLLDFEWQGHPYSSYLYQVARSVISEQYKKNERQAVDLESVVPSDDGSGENTIIAQADIQFVWETISDYPPPIPEIFELRFLEGLSFDEIATIVGKKPGAVRTAVSRTIAKIKKVYV